MALHIPTDNIRPIGEKVVEKVKPVKNIRSRFGVADAVIALAVTAATRMYVKK
jgi:hypothetical protein